MLLLFNFPDQSLENNLYAGNFDSTLGLSPHLFVSFSLRSLTSLIYSASP